MLKTIQCHLLLVQFFFNASAFIQTNKADKDLSVVVPPVDDLLQQLRIAQNNYEEAARQLWQLRQLIKKRTAYHRDQETFRDGQDDFVTLDNNLKALLSGLGGGCLCTGSAVLIQQIIRSSFVSSECSSPALQAPITSKECNKFVGLIFDDAANITMELLSEDMLCLGNEKW